MFYYFHLTNKEPEAETEYLAQDHMLEGGKSL